jgi:hypothetical protein
MIENELLVLVVELKMYPSWTLFQADVHLTALPRFAFKQIDLYTLFSVSIYVRI